MRLRVHGGCVKKRYLASNRSLFERYCQKVTIIWCCFFILNGSISVCTAFAGKLFGVNEEVANTIWSVYNGGISYVLMGLLFAIEFIVRKIVDKKMIKAYPITKFKSDSRKDEYVLCYEDYWTKKKYKTWKDFLIDTAKVRKAVNASGADEWILHCEDYWYFLVTFVALLQCKKSVSLTQNISESFIKEMKTPGVQLWTDVKINDSDFTFIPDVIEKAELPLEEEIISPATHSPSPTFPLVPLSTTSRSTPARAHSSFALRVLWLSWFLRKLTAWLRSVFLLPR